MPSIPLYRSSELRRIEAAAADLPLMQRAGLAAADLAVTLCAERRAAIVIFAGPGNNGGDAFEAARLLRERFFDVRVVFPGTAEALPADAAAAYARFVAAGGRTETMIAPDADCALVVDGLFGIGLTRPLGEPWAGLVVTANALAAKNRCPLLALDCPSGLDADTGSRQTHTIQATQTISFLAAKPGLFTADGPDCCGEISIAGLGLDTARIVAPGARTIATALFADHLRPRARNSHKGTFGDAAIIGGAPGMVGAALLAGRAALRLGSGRVYVGFVDDAAPAVDLAHPELMLRRADDVLGAGVSALACGPGLGRSAAARELLAQACSLALPLVIDADGLNLVAADTDLQTLLATRASPTLLTPHPAEAARLLGTDTATVQRDRIAAASELAARFDCLVALKGCGTIVATPPGDCFINTSGNPSLATAGSGDVLTGIVTALLTQGWPPLAALQAAVHLHGAAADRLVASGVGPVGLAAGELVDAARATLNDWIVARAE